MAVARYLGVGAHADVYRHALRAPNVLQNLLGEQALSAAFIPVYSRLLGAGRARDAGRFAGAVFGLLLAAVAVLVLLGEIFAPQIVAVLSAGFLGDAAAVAAGEMTVDRYPLTVRAVRIIFPMTGFAVLAAWALGVLNSHRRFLLPYLAPAIWNAAIITALLVVVERSGFLAAPATAAGEILDRWLFAICWGALAGGLLQFLVQVPLVWRLTSGLRVSFSRRVAGVGDALRAAGPALLGRGVVQLSIWIDMWLSSLLAPGAPQAIGLAGVLINLPLGAFGLSVAAAELPELASDGGEGAARRAARRISRAVRQSAFVICPAVLGYLAFGFLVAGLIYRGGRFSVDGNVLVAAVLAGYTLGLLASVVSRLLQNTFFALGDTRTPARVATLRLTVSAVVGGALMLILDRYAVADFLPNAMVGEPVGTSALRFGAVGLALASGLAAWCELAVLLRKLRRQLPELVLPWRRIGGLAALATASAVPAGFAWWQLRDGPLRLTAVVVLGLYMAVYLGYARWRGLPELEMWLGRWAVRRGTP